MQNFSSRLNHMEQLATKVLPCKPWWVLQEVVGYILSVCEQIMSLMQLWMQLFKKNVVTKKDPVFFIFIKATGVLAFLIILDLSVYFESFPMVLPPRLSLCFLWVLIQVFLPLSFLSHTTRLPSWLLFCIRNAGLWPVLVLLSSQVETFPIADIPLWHMWASSSSSSSCPRWEQLYFL